MIKNKWVRIYSQMRKSYGKSYLASKNVIRAIYKIYGNTSETNLMLIMANWSASEARFKAVRS